MILRRLLQIDSQFADSFCCGFVQRTEANPFFSAFPADVKTGSEGTVSLKRPLQFDSKTEPQLALLEYEFPLLQVAAWR